MVVQYYDLMMVKSWMIFGGTSMWELGVGVPGKVDVPSVGMVENSFLQEHDVKWCQTQKT